MILILYYNNTYIKITRYVSFYNIRCKILHFYIQKENTPQLVDLVEE